MNQSKTKILFDNNDKQYTLQQPPIETMKEYILKNKDIPIHLKKKVVDTCILPVLTYGVESKKSAEKLRKIQQAKRAPEESHPRD